MFASVWNWVAVSLIFGLVPLCLVMAGLMFVVAVWARWRTARYARTLISARRMGLIRDPRERDNL